MSARTPPRAPATDPDAAARAAAAELARRTGVERHDVAVVLGSRLGAGRRRVRARPRRDPGRRRCRASPRRGAPDHRGTARSVSRRRPSAVSRAARAHPSLRGPRRGAGGARGPHRLRRGRGHGRAHQRRRRHRPRLRGRPAGADQRPPQPHRALPAGRARVRRPHRRLRPGPARGRPPPRPDAWPRASTPGSPGPTSRRPPRSGCCARWARTWSGCRRCWRRSRPGRRGRRVAGIALVSNPAAGTTDEAIDHLAVLDAVHAAAARTGALLRALVAL